MTEIISSISASINILKALRSANEKIKSAEFANSLADLELQLAEMKAKIADLISQNTDLRTENQALKQKAVTAPELIFTNGHYYTAQNDGPFCTTCYEQSQKKVRLTQVPQGFDDLAKYTCPVCKNMY
mgnify:CR=1 FL=1